MASSLPSLSNPMSVSSETLSSLDSDMEAMELEARIKQRVKEYCEGPILPLVYPSESGRLSGHIYLTDEEREAKNMRDGLRLLEEEKQWEKFTARVSIEDLFFNSLILNEEDAAFDEFRAKKDTNNWQKVQEATFGLTLEEPKKYAQKFDKNGMNQFPEKSPLSVGVNLPVKVTHVISPGTFYIMPYTTETDSNGHDVGTRSFIKLTWSLTTFMNEEYKKTNSEEEVITLLSPVAVQLDFKKSLIEETIFEGRPPVWLRGTVEKMYRNSYQVVLKYIVYLVDYGAIVSMNALDGKVCVLPKKFIQHPPMAYKCHLMGIQPLSYGSSWESAEKEKFIGLVTNKIMLVIATPQDAAGLNKITEDFSCGIYMQDDTSDKYLDIGNEMVKDGLASHITTAP